MLKLFPVAGIDDVKHDVKHVYVLEEICVEGYLSKGELSVCKNLADAEIKTCSEKEAEDWLFDVNTCCSLNDNADSRSGCRPNFYEFSLKKLT